MIVVRIVLVKVIVLNRIFVKRMKVVIVLLVAVVLVLVRTTVICGKKLNTGTNHTNSNNCSSIITVAFINTNIRNYGIGHGGHNRISTHINI